MTKKEFINDYNKTHVLKFEHLPTDKQRKVLKAARVSEQHKTPLRKSFDKSGSIDITELICAGIGLIIVILFILLLRVI